MVFQIKAIDNVQEDLQFLSFFGIFKESLKILLTWPNIFLQVTLAFVFPHSCLFLAQNWISKFLSSKIHHKLSILPNINVRSPTYTKISNTISSEVATLWLIKAVYLTFSIILSLFAISAVVYTIACIYSGKNVTFRKVLSVVPKVWKRLMITFLCNFCVMFAYFCMVFIVVFIFTLLVLIFIMLIFKPNNNDNGIAFPVFIVMILYIMGLIYMAIIWQLANVISVMEKDCGFKALKKSKALIKGKMGTAFGIILVIGLCGLLIFEMVKKLGGVGMLGKITLGVPSVMLWSLLNLFTLVVHTIFYLVCKSYHHESLGEYVPLKSEESIQLQNI